MDYYKQYLIVGGMPQVVLEYLQSKSFSEADKIKRDLLNLYRDDIRKHADEINLKVEQIFDIIPSQLQKHEKNLICLPWMKMLDLETMKVHFIG